MKPDFTIQGKGWSCRMAKEIRASGLGRLDWYRYVYLKSRHWSELRERKLQAFGRYCDNCRRAGGNLHVHHLRYRKIYDVRLSDLQVLCNSCHHAEHKEVKVMVEPRLCIGLASMPEIELIRAIASGEYQGKFLRRLIDEAKRRAEATVANPRT